MPTKTRTSKEQSISPNRNYLIHSGTFAVQFLDSSGKIGYLDFLTKGHISIGKQANNHQVVCIEAGEIEPYYESINPDALVDNLARQRKLTEILVGKRTDFKIASFFYWWATFQTTSIPRTIYVENKNLQEIKYFTHSDLSQILGVTRATITRFIIVNEEKEIIFRHNPNRKLGKSHKKRIFIDKEKFIEHYGYF